MPQSIYKRYYANSWAVIVGIDDYETAGTLTYAVADARAFSDLLISHLDFEEERVHLLLNEDATRTNILGALSGIENEESSSPDDRIVFFFAGHGHTAKGGRGPVGFLVPFEGNPSNHGTLVYFDDLVRTSETLSAKHVLMVVDACYGGVILRRTVPPGSQRFLSDMMQRYSRQVIAAGKADETVADGGGPGGENSIFTGHLLEGASGNAASSDGVLTANGLMQYVYEQVSRDAKSDQSPHFGYLDGDGDVILQTPNGEHLGSEVAEDFQIIVPDQIAATSGPDSDATVRPSFVQRSTYSNPEHPSFGRNQWSAKLGEVRRDTNKQLTRTSAYSWLSLIAEPISQSRVEIDIAEELNRIPYPKPEQTPPYELFAVPPYKQTTIDTAIRYRPFHQEHDLWEAYLRIDQAGNIEYAESYDLFSEFQGYRAFKYVSLVGLCWQFQFLVRDVLQSNAYESGVRLTVSLVGTRDSILTEFSTIAGTNRQQWLQPFRSGYLDQGEGLLGLTCPNPNLQMSYSFSIASLDEDSSREIAHNIATQLSLAYNHQSQPRCFNHGTSEFPWNQYLHSRGLR